MFVTVARRVRYTANMPITPHTQQILDAFRLTAADLEQNRRGNISAEQVLHAQKYWERSRMVSLALGIGSLLFAPVEAFTTGVVTLDTISPPLVIFGVLALVFAHVCSIRKQQITALPLRAEDSRLTVSYYQGRRRTASPNVYKLGKEEALANIPNEVTAILSPDIRYRIYSVGMETVMLEPLEEPSILPVASPAALRRFNTFTLVYTILGILVFSFGLNLIEVFLDSRTLTSTDRMTQLPLPPGHTYTYGERIGPFQVNSVSERDGYTLVGLSGLITASGTVSRVSNGFAFVPDSEADVPFPPAPHTGYIALDPDPLLTNTIGSEGRWHARVQIDLVQLMLSSAGNATRGRVVSVTDAERIPEAE